MPVPMLERFHEIPDAPMGVALVPAAGAQRAASGLPPLLQVDMVGLLDFYFRFKYTVSAGTGVLNLSPYFPYNHIAQIQVPYQSGNLKAFDGDGHAAWLMNWMRSPERYMDKYPAQSLLGDQKSILATGYTPMSQTLVSSGSYTMTVAAKVFYFTLRIPYGLWFDTYYDYQPDGKIVPYNEVFVSPLLMASTGRSVVPVVRTNQVNGATVDIAPIAQTGASDFAIGSDQGSNFDIRRSGWRAPGAGMPMPRLFNWAYTVTVQRFPISNARPTFTLGPSGQLLATMVRLFDPTLTTIAATVGNAIPLANLTSATLKYGSGISKYEDDPPTHVRRILEQKGSMPTEGVLCWDMYGPSRTNTPGEIINTLNTAGVSISLDFGSNTPGAGSYADVIQEQLVLVK